MSNITRWSPFDDLVNTWPRSLFGRDFFAALRPNGEMKLEWNPRCDVTESEGAITIHAELPGVEAKDMDVAVTASQITIRGEKRSDSSSEKEGRTYQERFYGSFERTLPLPENIDPDNISANLKDGVLEVRIPLVAPPVTESKKVEIKAG